MPETTLSDTKEKIVMKDHDLLIRLDTQVGEILRRLDDSIRAEQDTSKSFAVEIKALSVEQARVSTDLKAAQIDMNEFKVDVGKRLERLETKSNMWDTINSFGVLIASYIGYIFGSR